MLYRRSAQLALQASLLLALHPDGTSRRVREIAAELGVPATYLAKVLQCLTRAGLLRAVRGPGGGVRLARSAREICLWDVLSALEPVSEFERCFLGLGQCSDQHPCPLHESWGPIRSEILAMLQTQSLLDFAQQTQKKSCRQERVRQ
ncbi:MAG: Rrf2 family transcriptional regulator [Acidobacteria bacterium]|nr:Rrf2 family transcriptional regulator [Acidobacteriota bacterium]